MSIIGTLPYAIRVMVLVLTLVFLQSFGRVWLPMSEAG